MNRIRTSLLLTSLFLTLAPSTLASTRWYVDGANGNDGNDCMSAQAACRTIGHAISLAASGDSIIVAPATYKENLTIGFSLNVIGSGASATIIDGASGGTVVTIPSASAQVTLSDLTIRNGFSGLFGGGIRNAGKLVVNNSTVSGNRVSRSCLNNPCYAYGGGIDSSGTLKISNSTIGPNSVRLVCGGRVITCQGIGGGIYGTGTLTTMNNGTIVGNSVIVTCPAYPPYPCSAIGGGLYIVHSTISNSTLSGNGVIAQGSKGGTQGSNISGSATLQNSILSNGPNGENCAGTMTSKGYNVSSDNTCNFNGPGDLNNHDPLLGTLGYYGGPTQTIPLLSGSPAIDGGNPSGCTDDQGNLLKTDQRGMPRPDPEDKGGCDMGAYESQSDQP